MLVKLTPERCNISLSQDGDRGSPEKDKIK